MAIKVLIVDDHLCGREGLAVRIASQSDMEVCGEAGDAAEAANPRRPTAPTWWSWISNWGPPTDWISSCGSRPATSRSASWFGRSIPTRSTPSGRGRPSPTGTSTSGTPRAASWRPFAASTRARSSSATETAPQCAGERGRSGKARKAAGVARLTGPRTGGLSPHRPGVRPPPRSPSVSIAAYTPGIAPREDQGEAGLEDGRRTEPRRRAMDAAVRLRLRSDH